MEQPEGSALPIEGGITIHVPVHPYEIVTVAADYAPAAQSRVQALEAKQ